MKLKSLWGKFTKGYAVLDEVSSKINGQIKVDEDLFGNKRLIVGGLAQSGNAVENIWQRAIEQFSNLTISNCLILGLGAGNAAKMVNKYFPKAKITGVEIDPEIIKLGKKYFGLGEIKNLDIIISDAIPFIINHQPLIINYDLILVDLYLGDCFPEKAESKIFLENLQKITKKEGIVILNRLYYRKNIEKTDRFEQKIRKVFAQIEAKKIDYNKLFLCRR